MGHPVTSLTYGLPEAASRLKIAPWHTRVRDWWACEANRPRQPGCHPHRHGQVSWKVCVYILWNNFSIHLNISMHVSVLFSPWNFFFYFIYLSLFYLFLVPLICQPHRNGQVSRKLFILTIFLSVYISIYISYLYLYIHFLNDVTHTVMARNHKYLLSCIFFSHSFLSPSHSRPLFLSTYHFLFYTDGIYASQVLMMFVQHERVERDARNPQPRDNLSSGSYFFGVKRPLLITSSVPPSVSTSHPLVCLVPISPRCTCS